MTTTTTVVLLCGLPGSGKSALATRIAERIQRGDANDARLGRRFDVHHVEYDALQDELSALSLSTPDAGRCQKQHKSDDGGQQGGWREQEERGKAESTAIGEDGAETGSCGDNGGDSVEWDQEAWNVARRKAMDEMERIVTAEMADPPHLSSGPGSRKDRHAGDLPLRHTVVILDDNFHLRGMRKQVHRRLWQLVKDARKDVADVGEKPHRLTTATANFGVLWIDTPAHICRARNRRRPAGRRVPEHVLDRMCETLEAPTREAWERESHLRIEVEEDKKDTQGGEEEEEEEEADSSGSVGTGADADADAGFQDALRFVLYGCPPIVATAEEELAVDIETLERERKRTLEDAAQRLDRLLRSWVGCVGRSSRPKLAGAANKVRKGLMGKLKRQEGEATDDATGDAGLVLRMFMDGLLPDVDDPFRSELLRLIADDRQHNGGGGG